MELKVPSIALIFSLKEIRVEMAVVILSIGYYRYCIVRIRYVGPVHGVAVLHTVRRTAIGQARKTPLFILLLHT